MFETTRLTNVRLCRDTLRISFLCAVFAVLGIVNASHHWHTFWQMSHSIQIVGYTVGIILLVAGMLYSLIFLFVGVVETVGRSKLESLFLQMGCVLFDLLFLMLNIPVLLSMYGILFKGYRDGEQGIAMPIVLLVVSLLVLAIDLLILKQAKTNGIENPGEHSPYTIFAAEDAELLRRRMEKYAAQPKVVAFCPHCGSPVNKGDTFCGSCGKKLPKEAD